MEGDEEGIFSKALFQPRISGPIREVKESALNNDYENIAQGRT